MSMEKTIFAVRISPGAARSEVTAFKEGIYYLRIAAAPEKGKANRETAAFLGSLLGVSKSSVVLLKGHTSRRKVFSASGINPEELRRRLIPRNPS